MIAILRPTLVTRPVADSVPIPILRNVKRLAWFSLLGALTALGGVQVLDDLPRQVSIELALGMIVVASWTIVFRVAGYLHREEARRAAEAEVARLEGARSTANAMQDRIANKLSLTVGYTEFLLADERLPDDLREQARKAMDGALAAAEIMSELKRLTRLDHERGSNGNGSDPGEHTLEGLLVRATNGAPSPR